MNLSPPSFPISFISVLAGAGGGAKLDSPVMMAPFASWLLASGFALPVLDSPLRGL
jgi:hypothetical protein